MKTKATVFTILVILILAAIMQFGFRHMPSAQNVGIQKASIFDFTSEADTFDFDKNEFREEIRKLKQELKNLKCEKIHAYFDSDEFKEEMNKLKEELKNMKFEKFHTYFDSDKFKEEMKKLKEELRDLNTENFHFEFDTEQFKKNMKELKENLKGHEFVWKDFDLDIDLSGLEESMEELKENMKNLKINMEDLSVEMERLKEFITDLKSEMKNDGLIEDADDDVDIEFNKNEMKVNGNRVPDELFEKYKAIYKEHYGKEPDEDTHFHIN